MSRFGALLRLTEETPANFAEKARDVKAVKSNSQKTWLKN